jgi:hypothetical protein
MAEGLASSDEAWGGLKDVYVFEEERDHCQGI